MRLYERLKAETPKRILSLDGGGARIILSLGFLEELERVLRDRHEKPDLRLCDYFDLIGGTSAGALVEGSLSRGLHAESLPRLSVKGLGIVSFLGHSAATGSLLLISTHIRSAGNRFASTTLSAGHHTADAGLDAGHAIGACLLYTSPSPRDVEESRMPSSA